MIYSFDHNIAVMYGVDEAIMINNLSFWIGKNKANKQHFYEGRYWTYNTVEAYTTLFPFWSEKQIRRVLKSLLDLKILIKGNFNKKGFDRTSWYAFYSEDDFLGDMTSQSVKSKLPNGKLHSSKRENGSAQTGTTIPDIKTTDINPDINSDKSNVDSDKSSSVAFKQMVHFWLKEYHKGWLFDPIDGKSLKLLITKIKKILVAHGRLAGDQEVIDFFIKMCQSLPDFYKGEGLPTLNRKFNEIITKISESRTKERSRYGGDSVYRN